MPKPIRCRSSNASPSGRYLHPLTLLPCQQCDRASDPNLESSRAANTSWLSSALRRSEKRTKPDLLLAKLRAKLSDARMEHELARGLADSDFAGSEFAWEPTLQPGAGRAPYLAVHRSIAVPNRTAYRCRMSLASNTLVSKAATGVCAKTAAPAVFSLAKRVLPKYSCAFESVFSFGSGTALWQDSSKAARSYLSERGMSRFSAAGGFHAWIRKEFHGHFPVPTVKGYGRAGILIVEDEGIIPPNHIASTLLKAGYAVAGIAEYLPTRTLAKVEQSNPSLILMDIRIKGPMDGVETAAKLRERFLTSRLFI